MDGYSETVAAVKDLTAPQVVLFGAGAACRVAPAVQRFGSADTWRRFAEGLDALWAAGGQLEAERAARLLAALDRIPEVGVEEATVPEYDAMLGVLTLAAALQVARGDEVAKPTQAMCALPREWSAGVDAVLGHARPARWWNRQSPASGRFESAEAKAQQDSLRFLAEHEAIGAVVQPIRLLSEQRAAEVASVLAEYGQQQGWAMP